MHVQIITGGALAGPGGEGAHEQKHAEILHVRVHKFQNLLACVGLSPINTLTSLLIMGFKSVNHKLHFNFKIQETQTSILFSLTTFIQKKT